MGSNSIALLIYGEPGSTRNALSEEKYKKLGAYLIDKGFIVDSVLYHDSISSRLEEELLNYKSILVWVNPIEQYGDRKTLDSLLIKLSEQGCFVSAHPDTILKMGTKEILYKIRETSFGGDTKLYRSFIHFKDHFLPLTETRILKQYRGNGGNGVFKVSAANDRIKVTHAKNSEEELMDIENFLSIFESYFANDGMLIDQAWNANITNGMVRCYLAGNKVAGFGYQEVNALYPVKKPSQRFYFSEECGLFRDLREIMENKWLGELQEICGVKKERLPVIWDADFFINKVNTTNTGEKYTLCEINVSCVSPFPESAIPYIANELIK
ncbi:MAG TPA: Cj0069 family protein [Chitinophagaceae bacterium]